MPRAMRIMFLTVEASEPVRFQKSAAALISFSFNSTHWPLIFTRGIFKSARRSNSSRVISCLPKDNCQSNSTMDSMEMPLPCITGVFTFA